MAIQRQLTPEDFVQPPGSGQNPTWLQVLGINPQGSVDDPNGQQQMIKEYDRQFGQGAFAKVYNEGDALWQKVRSYYDYNKGKYVPGGVEAVAQLLPSKAASLGQAVSPYDVQGQQELQRIQAQGMGTGASGADVYAQSQRNPAAQANTMFATNNPSPETTVVGNQNNTERQQASYGAQPYNAADGATIQNILQRQKEGRPLQPWEKNALARAFPNGQGTAGTGTGVQTGSATSTTGTQTTNSGSGNTAGNQQNAAPDSLQAALDIISSSSLPDDVKALFSTVVQGWDPAKEANMPNIINKFNEIKASTIDPHFQELSRIALDELSRTQNAQQQARGLELETQGINAQQAIQGAQNSLEARGMTFSGQGREQLGARSAYGQGGEQGNQIQQLQFGTPMEGLVNTGNRLISSSSEARYKQNREALARQAEQYFGSNGATGLVPGVAQMGGVTGSLNEAKNAAYAGTLSSLSGQQGVNTAAQTPLKFNFGTSQ